MHPLERPYQTSTEVAPDAEAIVVLAGSIRTAQGARTSAEPGPDTVYRCLHAAALHRSAPHLPVIICGGADGQGGPAYSYVMRDFLLGQGVRAEAIIMDDRSRNTFENAVEASRLLRERGLQRASLVTDASHMRRAVGCFQTQGVEVSPSACNHLQPEYHPKLSHLLPSSRSVAVVNAAFHEWLGLLVYRVRGRI